VLGSDADHRPHRACAATLALELLAEKKIEEALARGELERLPGAGHPLAPDDGALVPEDLRMIYRILRNAGFVPPEVEARGTTSPRSSGC